MLTPLFDCQESCLVVFPNATFHKSRSFSCRKIFQFFSSHNVNKNKDYIFLMFICCFLCVR